MVNQSSCSLNNYASLSFSSSILFRCLNNCHMQINTLIISNLFHRMGVKLFERVALYMFNHIPAVFVSLRKSLYTMSLYSYLSRRILGEILQSSCRACIKCEPHVLNPFDQWYVFRAAVSHWLYLLFKSTVFQLTVWLIDLSMEFHHT